MLSSLLISSRSLVKRRLSLVGNPSRVIVLRNLSFTFAGTRNLDEIVKKDILENKSAAEISDIWYTYHEERENVHGIIMPGSDGKTVLSRAAKW